MATKARAVKLEISKEDTIDLAIWKLLADRVGRTATDIADELAVYGFAKDLAVGRAKALMRRGWFERVEKKSQGLTKYILKKDTKMPKQEKNDLGLEGDEDNTLPEGMQLGHNPSLERGADVVLHTHPVAQPAAVKEPKIDPINPAEGVFTCIWKVMNDHEQYTKDDVVTLLGAAGIGESTAKQKFAEAILKGWFVAEVKQEGGKEVKYFRLQDHIEKPVDDKPYRARGSYKKEVPAADLVDQMMPNKSIGESEVRIAMSPSVFTEQDISDAELAAWTRLALWSKDTSAGLVDELVQQNFNEDEAKQVVSDATKYWGVEEKSDAVWLSIPTAISRTTVTKERIADFKTAFHKKWREEPLGRNNPCAQAILPEYKTPEEVLAQYTAPITNKEEKMAKNQTEEAPKTTRAPTKAALAKLKKLEEAATVLLWNLVKENRGNEEENVLDAFARSEYPLALREKVLADNQKYFDVTMMAEVNYIKSPFAAEHPELTLQDIEEYKVKRDAKPDLEPFGEEVVKSITAYDGCLRSMYLLLKDKKVRSRDEFERVLRFLNFTGPMISSMLKLLIAKGEVIASAGEHGHTVQATDMFVEIKPMYRVAGGLDPMDGIDYCLYQIVKDGEPRYLADIVKQLAATGIGEARIRDRLLQLTGVQYNFLDMRNTDEGMKFTYVSGGAVPEKKGIIKANEAITPLVPQDGFLYNLYRSLSVKGASDFETLAHLFISTGYDRNILKPLLDDLIARKLLITQGEDKLYRLIDGVEVPKRPMAYKQNTLSHRDGLNYCIWALLADGNWTTEDDIAQLLGLIGFDRSRAKDRIAKLADKDGLITLGKIGEYQTIRLADNAVQPAKDEAVEEERRGGVEERRAPETSAAEELALPETSEADKEKLRANVCVEKPVTQPAPSGLHAYEPDASKPKTEDQEFKQPEPLLEVKIKVAGMELPIAGLFSLYTELLEMGFGFNYLPPSTRGRVMQSTHKIGGRVMHELELQQLAVELSKQLPPVAWTSATTMHDNLARQRMQASAQQPGARPSWGQGLQEHPFGDQPSVGGARGTGVGEGYGPHGQSFGRYGRY